jgi:hypothetical protein
MGTPHFVRIEAERVAQVEHSETRSSRMVFVGDRCAEERHDPVAGVLIDRALEAVNSLGKDRESR